LVRTVAVVINLERLNYLKKYSILVVFLHDCLVSLLYLCLVYGYFYGGTTAAAPPPFRPSDPALCGSCPLVTHISVD